MAEYLELSDSVTIPDSLFQPPTGVRERSHLKSLLEYQTLYNESLQDPKVFWTRVADDFYWEQRWSDEGFHSYNYDRTRGKVEIKWFEDATTNICYNCLDRNISKGLGGQIAFYWEGNDPADHTAITYQQLLERVCRFANALKAKGVKKGDPVAIYQPMILDLVVAMLATARIGAIHSIVFGGFSALALSDRILDSQCRVLITADGVYRGSKYINLKEIADEAVRLCYERGFEVNEVIVSKSLGDKAADKMPWHEGRDSWFHELESVAPAVCEPEWVSAEHPLFMLYTSGSTGKPKGVLHSTGGYMLWTSLTHKYSFDYHAGDIYWCTADIGWITGHSYITYGPLLNGAISVMFEGIPTFPDASRFWQVVEKYKVNQFYTAPTAIRALMRYGPEFVSKCDRSSLRVLGTVGEPINPEAWLWYYKVVGEERCYIADTWWQTETGGHMMTGIPGVTPMKPGSTSLPMFGIVPKLMDGAGQEVVGKGEGFLVIERPWPGQMRTVYGDHDRFEMTYFSSFNGYYCTGDGARRDEHGFYWITGRTDDVINVSGHRIGTAELESSLARHKDVVEAAIVGFPHAIKGEGIYAYVIAREGVQCGPAAQAAMKEQIRQDIGSFAAPDIIHHTTGLPKTRSGKIMRRILRKIANREEESLGDVSTLADPTVIESLLSTRPDTTWKS